MIIFSLYFSIFFDRHICSSLKSLVDRCAIHHTLDISLELYRLLPSTRNPSPRIYVRNHRRQKCILL